MKRRRFLETSIVGLGAAAVMPRRGGAGPPDSAFPSAPRARLAVASYPFREFVDPKKGSMPLLDFPKMVADRYGLAAIEPLDRHFPATDAAYLGKLRST